MSICASCASSCKVLILFSFLKVTFLVMVGGALIGQWWLQVTSDASFSFAASCTARTSITMGNCLGVDTTATDTTGDSFVDVLFFPDPAMPCKNFHSDKGCTRKNCKSIHDQGSSLMTMLGFLKSANKTMDICVFTITCDEIAEAVLDAHARGVKVRVITDDGQAKGKGSDIQKFIDAGIPVRDDNARTYMHHKFCVIDKKVLLNGSFNWSRQAVVGNAENLVVHKDGLIVGRFDEHFAYLWKKYER